jgi:hypothetical protein
MVNGSLVNDLHDTKNKLQGYTYFRLKIINIYLFNCNYYFCIDK